MAPLGGVFNATGGKISAICWSAFDIGNSDNPPPRLKTKWPVSVSIILGSQIKGCQKETFGKCCRINALGLMTI